MRVDFEGKGKNFSLIFNDKPLDHCVWADEQTGEALVFETDYRTGEYIKDDDSPHWGRRTLLLKGKVKITDNRLKQSKPDIADWECPTQCCVVKVHPNFYPDFAHLVMVTDLVDNPIQSFTLAGNLGALCGMLVLFSKNNSVDHFCVEPIGMGNLVIERLREYIGVPVYPL